ncbi:MAG: hypothetical protein J5832_00250, partial [Clostridia bacterium]|nr:hypothetical protein [Clostridia bacterium]
IVFFKIEEIDRVEWVYSDMYYYMSKLRCAVEITDEYENLFYKPGKDDDIIAFLEEHGLENPKFGYKCELNAFVKEKRVWSEINDIDPFGTFTQEEIDAIFAKYYG